MRIGKAGILISIAVIVFGGIAVSDALGLWVTESTKEPVKIASGEFQGFSDPNDIRGSYTFADIEKSFGVKANSLAEAFGIEGTDEENAAYKCNGLEEMYAGLSQEIGTDSVRLFVGMAAGLPVEKGSYLPETASNWLLKNAQLSDEDKQYLVDHTIYKEEIERAAEKNEELNLKENTVKQSGVPAATETEAEETEDKAQTMEPAAQPEEPAEVVPEQPAAQVPEQTAAEETEHSLKETGTIKGSTTIWDVMQWGVAREDIGPAIGIELPDDNGAKLRDLIIAAGKSFDEAKVILQDMVDKVAGK